jgi:predicted porin
MNKTALCAAIAALYAIATPAFADELSDLKAEIAAQKQAAAAQKARLDALEQKLNAVQQQQAAAPSAPVAAAGAAPSGVSYSQGQGLSYTTPSASVSLYGLIDVSYVHTNHGTAAGDSFNGPRVAWFSGNRWGVTGKRAMGDSGLDVIFRLEAEYESQTGSDDTPGVTFNRDSWVGVQSKDLGKLTLGRQNAIGRDPISSAIYGDPYGPAAPSLEEGGYSNNNNFKQLIFYAGSATGTRINNGVVWKKDFGPLYVGAQYQFGGVAGNFNKGSTETVSLAYAGGPFNVAGFVTSANVAGLNNKSYSVGGNYTAGPIRINTGLFHYTADQGAAGALGQRSDNAFTLSGKYTLSEKIDYELGYQNMKANHAAVNSGGNVINAFANASASTLTATGSRSTLYASAFYHFDKITEIYIAGDYLKLKDGYKVGVTNGFPSQAELAIGLRTRF